MRKLRVAVIGAGRLGEFHAQKLARIADADLVAVVDPVEACRQRVAAASGAPGLPDHRPLLGQIDAAVVATPTQQHFAVASELLNWGVHVLVEKPLCATAAQADELVRLARRNGAVLQVGHVERFNPAMTAAAAHLAEPKYIESIRAGSFTFRSTDVGVVLDLMVHDLDLTLWLVRSPVRKIDAMGLSVLGGHEDVANVRIEFECGCVAVLSASRVSYESVRRMQVWSAGGFAAVDFAARKTTVVRPSEALRRRELDVMALAADARQDKNQILQQHLRREVMQFDAFDALELEIDDFLQSIHKQRPPRVTGEDGRDAVALAERILRKIQSHAWDNRPSGLVGPMAAGSPAVIPAPHFTINSSPYREAG